MSGSRKPRAGTLWNRVRRLLNTHRGEGPAVFWSFCYFFTDLFDDDPAKRQRMEAFFEAL